MTRRDVIIDALEFRPPPYVPWQWDMTVRCAERFRRETGMDDLTDFYDPHFLKLGADAGRRKQIGENLARDAYGVVWDCTVDKDIGTPCDWPIKQPEDLDSYDWPDTDDDRWYRDIPQRLAERPDLFRVYSIGFSLFERAWTMRGMTDLLMDMIERPDFVEQLLDAIVRCNLKQIRRALEFDVDCVHFGDDYGMQTGLIMGGTHWRHFIKPRLAKMFAPIREAGKYISMHSCGCVAELFDDLIEIGLNMFNPFQPEVMDVFALKEQYHGRLAFHGGFSVQKLLPFGTPDEVRQMTLRLIEAGAVGGYVFSPSHGVPGDVPSENLLAMVEVLKSQPCYQKM